MMSTEDIDRTRREQTELVLIMKCGSVRQAAIEFLKEDCEYEFSNDELELIIEEMQKQIRSWYREQSRHLQSHADDIHQRMMDRLTEPKF